MRLLAEPEHDRAPGLEALADLAWAAHAGGLDGVLLSQDETLPAPLVTAAALAARVPDVLIAVEVAVGDRHPFELAEEAAVVDCASGGRLLLVTRPAAGAAADYAEALDLVRTALTPRPFRFEGRRWQVPANLAENVHASETHVRLTPAPVQVRLPIWGAGAGRGPALERGLGWLAEAGDDPDELATAFARAAAALGPAALGAPRARRDRLDDPSQLVARLRAGQTSFGQDWAVVTADVAGAAVLGEHVRPRVQLHRLDPALEALWEPAA